MPRATTLGAATPSSAAPSLAGVDIGNLGANDCAMQAVPEPASWAASERQAAPPGGPGWARWRASPMAPARITPSWFQRNSGASQRCQPGLYSTRQTQVTSVQPSSARSSQMPLPRSGWQKPQRRRSGRPDSPAWTSMTNRQAGRRVAHSMRRSSPRAAAPPFLRVRTERSWGHQRGQPSASVKVAQTRSAGAAMCQWLMRSRCLAGMDVWRGGGRAAGRPGTQVHTARTVGRIRLWRRLPLQISGKNVRIHESGVRFPP